MGGLKGKTICFTGTLQGMGRAEAGKKATKAGAIVKGSVVKTLDFLVAAEGAGAKVDKAGPDTEILTQEEFEEMVGGGGGGSKKSPAKKPAKKTSKSKQVESSDEDDSSDESSEPPKKKKPVKKSGGGGGSLKGKTICFTGTLQGMGRAEAGKKATKAGAIVKGTVVKTLDFLVAAEGAGAKVDKAGPDTEILTQEEFEEMVGGGGGGSKKSPAKKPAKKTSKSKQVESSDEDDSSDESSEPPKKKKPVKKSGGGGGSLKGKTICFTGTLQGMGRAEAGKKATKAGAIVKGTVVKTLDFLVAAEGAGAKVDKAGPDTEILTQEEFEEMVGGGGGDSKKSPTKKSKSKRKKDDSSDEDSESEEEKPQKKKRGKKAASLKGKTICFTGTLQGMGRAEAGKKATKAGAIVKGSVVKTLDFLVAAEGAGAKVDKAGPDTEILTQEEFEEML